MTSVNHVKALLELGLEIEYRLGQNPLPSDSVKNDLVFGYMTARHDTLEDIRTCYFQILKDNCIETSEAEKSCADTTCGAKDICE